MNGTILVTRPNHDDTTFYCSEWADEIIKFAKERGFKVIDLEGERATKHDVESCITKQNPSLILFNGHGSDRSVAGHKDEILIEAGVNHHLLRTRVIHSLSCSSANQLGPVAVENDTKAYIGYSNDFVFFHDKNKSAHPHQDDIARPFFDSANQVPLGLLDRKNVEEAVNRSYRNYDYWIAYYRLHGELLEAPQNLIGLIWDKMSLTFHGDPEAKI